MTMLTFETDSPQTCGIVDRDNDMIVRNFFEKVNNPPSNIANGAIYIFESTLLEEISEKPLFFLTLVKMLYLFS